MTLQWNPWATSLQEDEAERSTARATTKAVQAVAQANKRTTVAAEDRALGAVYGNTWVQGKVDIFRQIESYVYIRALLGVGEWEAIDLLQINGTTFLSGTYSEADPDYQGEWGVDTSPPETITAGDVWKYGGVYYEVQETFTSSSDTGCYVPTGTCYQAYFKQILESVESNTYTGSSGQGVDSILSAVISGYDDTCTGTEFGESYALAYVVIKMPLADYGEGFPRVQVKSRALKVYDPDTALTSYSDNAALCRADFLSSKLYGAGLTCDSTTLSTAKAHCAELVNGVARSSVNLDLGATPQDVGSWDAVLREYAYCWAYLKDGTVYFVADDSCSVCHTLTPGNDSVPLELPSVEWLSDIDRPNSVRVKYTAFVAGDAKSVVTDKAQTAAVVALTEDERLAEFSMPGFIDGTQAETYRDHRLAQATYERYRSTFTISHYGEEIDPGEVVTVPWSTSANKELRVLTRTMTQPGHYRITGQHYASEVYA
jgi:hypothetical protein